MAGEACNETVLAAVGFVGDDDDVPAVGQERMGISFLIREELLDGGEHHAPGRDGKFLT